VVPSAGERRHLTVLFCDLVSSTEIAARLDPEEWREVVAGYHRAAAQAITRYGGHVAKYLGDGVMAFFGYPEAHDNDAERAARAGLAILEGVLKLNHGSTGPKLAARVGIDSGAVVVGAGADKDTDVFGETPNIAARLQATAKTGTVLITAATHRLLSGLFVVEALGPRALKGITTALEVFQVIRPTGVRGRLGAARGLTPFVGREDEMLLLLSRWERAREGEGQLALIIGEPGIGKSRLVAEFHDRIRDTPHIWLESGGEQVFEHTPFHAIIEMLARWLELQDATNIEEQCERLERALAAVSLNGAEIAPLIADLLQLPAGGRYPALALTAEQKRRRLLAALSGWVLEAARGQPLVMVVEDLHWLDPSTLELLQLLAAQGATVPLMLLYTARPEFRTPWPMRTHHSQLALNRLSSSNVREMVALVAARHALASDSVEAVVERAVGVPLFVEELTRAVLENDSAQGSGREIPATLHDSLTARLDRLGAAKEIIQIGAVIGGEFSYGLLHAVHPIPDEELQSALYSVTDADLVYIRGIPPYAVYQFKHALIRDAAYEALLRSRRKELHARIAEVLVGQFPTSAPELLAHHYTEAGSIELAIPYWQQAGQRALQRSAHAEAAGHLTKGLELLKTLPQTQERTEQELVLQTALGPALMVTTGYTSAEVEQTYTRALELCRQIRRTPQLFSVLRGLWELYEMRGELQTARELAEQLLTLGQNDQDPALLVIAHDVMGDTLFMLGEFIPARKHLEQGIALYDFQQHRSLAFLHGGYDPGIACLCHLAHAIGHLGYPDQAVKRSQEALTLAQELAHPFSLGMALNFAVWLSQLNREVERAQEQAERLIALATEQEYSFFLAQGIILRGWALSMQEQGEKGIAEMRRGIAAYRAIGTELLILHGHSLVLLAEVYGKAGHGEEGLTALAEALALIDTTGERWYEAELYRLKGTLTLQSQVQSHEWKVEEAEEYFSKAIEVARRQQAKSLELRTVMSLSRLWQRQGKKAQAQSMLAEIYGWFTEGFDTADLKDAKALLDELSR
jgi:class 3 adenylate cyclase/tetratricopeptide (TPR) repeat protein